MEETALPMANSTVSGAGLVQLDPAVADAEAQIEVTGTSFDALQGGPAITLSPPTVTDAGTTILADATITIANGSGNAVAGDELYVNGVQNGSVGDGVTASWSATTNTLTLTGSATLANYESLLDQVTYQDTGTDSSSGSHPQRTVTWTVNDGTESFDTTSQVTIDRPPVANNDVASDGLGLTVTTTAATGVLSNDTDLDDDKLTVTGVSDAANGAGSVGISLAGVYGHLTLNADGSYSYVADNLSAINSAPTGSHPVDSFTYTVSDGNGGTASAALMITLDRPPVVTGANVVLSAGHASIAASLLFTASDPDGDAITMYGFMDTGPGDFVLNGVTQQNDQEIDVTGAQLSQLTYQSTPGTTDTLQVRADDGTLWSNWSSFTVTAPPSVTVIQTDTNSSGTTTSLVEAGNHYYLYGSGGTGPELSFSGAAVVAGEFGAWVPFGAVQTATGYDIAWKMPGANEYTVWQTDSNGNWISDLVKTVPGNNPTLETLERTFNQDLNGDGIIGPPTTAGLETQSTASALTSAAGSATISTGGTLELDAAYSGVVAFNGPTGTLILDHSSAFTGEIFNFTGNGNLSTSDQIDLKDILFGPGTTDSYTGNTSGGVLTVSDAQHDTASISLAGNYTDSTFSFSSDGDGGTLVVDPPATQALASGVFTFNDPDSTGTSTVSVTPHNGGSGYVGNFTLDAVSMTNGQDSVDWHFNLDPDSISITQTITQSYDVTIADAQPNGTNSTATQSIAVTIGGPGNDTFVFKPGFGSDVIANATSADTIELNGFSSVPNMNELQTLLSEAQTGQSQSLFHTANNGHDTVIDLGNHDSITLANVPVTDLHTSNFIIHPAIIG